MRQPVEGGHSQETATNPWLAELSQHFLADVSLSLVSRPIASMKPPFRFFCPPSDTQTVINTVSAA